MQGPAEGIIETEMLVEEPHYHFTPDFWDQYRFDFKHKRVDIIGWLQSEKYWLHCRDKVFEALCMQPGFVQETKAKLAGAFEKETIAISIRRGDFITNPNHFLLPLEFYLKALVAFFPDYPQCNIIVFSDDPSYCRKEIRALPNVYFAAGYTAMEQLCLMSLCSHFIISNSTFSWWGAMLGEKKGAKIIRSPYYVSGDLAKKIDYKDYYPERWIVFNHEKDHSYVGGLKRNWIMKLLSELSPAKIS